MTPDQALVLALVDAQDARVRAMQEIQALQAKIQEMEKKAVPAPKRGAARKRKRAEPR